MSGRRRVALTVGAVAALALAIVLARHPIVSFTLQRVLSVATGYDVRFRDEHLGWSHGAFFNVHVAKNGDPVLEADRIDVDYALRDIFPGGRHRYGFASVAVQRPTLTLLRHRDGSFNFNRGGTSSSPPQETKHAATPLLFTVRLTNGTIRLLDTDPLQPDLAAQSIVNVTIDASVESDGRTTARVDGTFIGRRRQAARVEGWPLRIRSAIDYPRGFAIHRITAAALPLRGALGFFLHTPVARFDDGVVRNVNVFAYALDINSGRPFSYRLGGSADLDGGQLAAAALERPVRDLHGHVTMFDDGFTTLAIAGQVAGIPMRARGGLYDLAAPKFRFGITGDGSLTQLRTLFAFARTRPISGPAHLEALIGGSVDSPMIRTYFASSRFIYDTIAVDRVRGIADYAESQVAIRGFTADYGPLHAAFDGAIQIGARDTPMQFFVRANGPGDALPYVQRLLAGDAFDGAAIVAGTANTGFHVGGMIEANGPSGGGAGFIAVDERGRGEFGPFIFERNDGSSLAGGLRLERPLSESAGWVDVHGYRLDIPEHDALLPGALIPGFPPFGGRLDAQLVGGGTPLVFGLAGHFHVTGARYDRYSLGTVQGDLAGTLNDMRLRHVAMAGPLGGFRGDGAFAGQTFAVSGDYDGSLEQLAPLTGDLDAHGRIQAPVAALIGPQIFVQTTGAVLRGASVRGIALDRASGTLAIGARGVRILAADADLEGARAVVTGEGDGSVAISAPNVPARALRGAGLPLDRGRISVYGVGDPNTPRFAGTVNLGAGSFRGYPIAGWADLAFQGRTLAVDDGIAALGTTYGRIGGQVNDVGGTAFRYDLNASIPSGDAATLVHDLRLPVRNVEASFDARFRVAGTAAAPLVDGTVNAPEGAYNGLPFRAASGQVSIALPALRIDAGRVTVGSTVAAFSAALGPGSVGFTASSRAANLADFDDFFDEGDMLAGSGPIALTFSAGGRAAQSTGNLDLHGVRLRRYPLGDVTSRWSTAGGRIAGTLASTGSAGALTLRGTVTPGVGSPLAVLTGAGYDAQVTIAGLDLGTWVNSAGISMPVGGKLDGTARLSGRYPDLALDGSLALSGGTIGPYPFESASLKARIAGRKIAVDAASADFGFATFTGSGTFGLARSDPLALRIHVAIPDVGAADRRLEPRRPLDVAGALDADATVSGTYAAPRINAGFDLENARCGTFSVPHVIGDLSSDLHSLVLNSAEFAFTSGTATLAGSLPISLSPLGIGPASAPISLTADIHEIALAPFAPFVPGKGTRLGGTVDGHLALEGTPASPRLLGTATLADGSYVSSIESSPIQHVTASLNFNGTSVALQALHADVGKGALDGSGQLVLPFPNAPKSGYAASLTAHGAQLNFPSYGGGQLDGTLQIASGPTLPTLSGNLTLTNTTIPFATIFRSAAGSEPGSASPFNLAFDLHATAGKNVRVKSSIIDVGATGEIDLSGTLLSPRLAGELTATRGGIFSTYNRAFRIENATVRFDPNQGIVPDLDLEAVAHVTNPDPDPDRNAIGSADIRVHVQGPADAYTITYSSQPPYSQAQIVGLLVDATLLGAVNFNTPLVGGVLRGAPGESNVLLPPGVTPYQTGSYGFSQEAFSLLNTQLTQHFLGPLENAFGGLLGLTDFGITLDYGGRLGYSARQQLPGKKNIAISLGQILSYPSRTEFGFEARPDATTSLDFTYFQQEAPPAYTLSGYGSETTPGGTVLQGIEPLSNRQGFRITLTRRYP